MREIVVLVPDVIKEQQIEIDIRINGLTHGLQYRLEMLNWNIEKRPATDRAHALRSKIESYDQNWELVEIGPPSDNNILLMFRKRINS